MMILFVCVMGKQSGATDVLVDSLFPLGGFPFSPCCCETGASRREERNCVSRRRRTATRARLEDGHVDYSMLAPTFPRLATHFVVLHQACSSMVGAPANLVGFIKHTQEGKTFVKTKAAAHAIRDIQPVQVCG